MHPYLRLRSPSQALSIHIHTELIRRHTTYPFILCSILEICTYIIYLSVYIYAHNIKHVLWQVCSSYVPFWNMYIYNISKCMYIRASSMSYNKYVNVQYVMSSMYRHITPYLEGSELDVNTSFPSLKSVAEPFAEFRSRQALMQYRVLIACYSSQIVIPSLLCLLAFTNLQLKSSR